MTARILSFLCPLDRYYGIRILLAISPFNRFKCVNPSGDPVYKCLSLKDALQSTLIFTGITRLVTILFPCVSSVGLPLCSKVNTGLVWDFPCYYFSHSKLCLIFPYVYSLWDDEFHRCINPCSRCASLKRIQLETETPSLFSKPIYRL